MTPKELFQFMCAGAAGLLVIGGVVGFLALAWTFVCGLVKKS